MKLKEAICIEIGKTQSQIEQTKVDMIDPKSDRHLLSCRDHIMQFEWYIMGLKKVMALVDQCDGSKSMDQATLRFMSKVSYALGFIDTNKSSTDPKGALDKVSDALSTALEDFILETAGDHNASN